MKPLIPHPPQDLEPSRPQERRTAMREHCETDNCVNYPAERSPFCRICLAATGWEVAYGEAQAEVASLKAQLTQAREKLIEVDQDVEREGYMERGSLCHETLKEAFRALASAHPETETKETP